jgi:formylglycine-generating enzyme required for sulfatase activity
VRLCTEAEWEFAARGGKFSQGFSYSGSNTLENVGWCFANASSRVHTVGMKLPNELGIYDMSGNAWEWCSDWYGFYSFQTQANPTGPGGGSSKIFRGGSWFDYGLGASDCRVETRYSYTINSRTEDGGFRIVKEL